MSLRGLDVASNLICQNTPMLTKHLKQGNLLDFFKWKMVGAVQRVGAGYLLSKMMEDDLETVPEIAPDTLL